MEDDIRTGALELLLVLLQRVGSGTPSSQMLVGLKLTTPCVWQQLSKRTQTANSRTEDHQDALVFGEFEPERKEIQTYLSNSAAPPPPCCGDVKCNLEVKQKHRHHRVPVVCTCALHESHG